MAERSHAAEDSAAGPQWNAATEKAKQRAAVLRQFLSAEWVHPDAGTDAPQPSSG